MSANEITTLTIFYGGLSLFVIGGSLYCLHLIRRAKRERQANDSAALVSDVTSGTISIPPGTQFANVRSLSPAGRDLAHRA